MNRKISRREFLNRGAISVTALSVSTPLIIRGLTRQAGKDTLRTVASIDKAAISKLASGFRGQVLLPGDRDYLSACQDWTGQIPVRPGLLLRCDSTGDVVASVNFARDNGILPAVRSGGHGRFRAADGGMRVDLSRMNTIEVNRSRRTVRCEPGVTGGALDRTRACIAEVGLHEEIKREVETNYLDTQSNLRFDEKLVTLVEAAARYSRDDSTSGGPLAERSRQPRPVARIN